MPSVKNSSKASNNSKKSVSCGGSAKIKKYFQARREFPTLTKTKCMEIAGYKHDNAGVVEKTLQFQALWRDHADLIKSLDKDVATRIREAQLATGASAKNNLNVLQGIINKKAAKDRDRVSATKEVTTITGERMPEQVDHNLTGDEELLTKILSG